MTVLAAVPNLLADVHGAVATFEQTATSWVGPTTRVLVPAGSAHRSAVTAVAADRNPEIDEGPDAHRGLVSHRA